ncbi:hypothetical protein [Dyadobacter sp. CY312]|uniref:hypothetical protein n=1 Tax=Dyadobacter sp. CY312 TaxID=2907303 RepID=UPI001F45A453|nr:hypothetical protein [Dyadobacter sp. CY312]MCE7042886.1 hypothetical protein [Dyadobacter sp. CY312]
MKSLANTTELLENTTNTLTDENTITPQLGVALIDQWLVPLSESDNLQPIAQELRELKALLLASPTDSTSIVGKMAVIAAKVLLIAPDVGAEGEMPSLLSALSSALKLGASNDDKE